MNNFEFSIVCPDCRKKMHVGGTLEAKSITTTGAAPAKAKKPKPKKKPAAKKKTASKKKPTKGGGYDEDLQKLFKLKSGGPAEDIKLSPSEQRDPAVAMKKMEEAAKKDRQNAKNNPDPLKKINEWLSGGNNPFSE